MPKFISIHDSLARVDSGLRVIVRDELNFNPRLSCESRPYTAEDYAEIERFQSTTLFRESTRYPVYYLQKTYISIHDSLARVDLRIFRVQIFMQISIHDSLARVDTVKICIGRDKNDFNPRLSCESRLYFWHNIPPFN